jgi:hypothetical protein
MSQELDHPARVIPRVWSLNDMLACCNPNIIAPLCSLCERGHLTLVMMEHPREHVGRRVRALDKRQIE